VGFHLPEVFAAALCSASLMPGPALAQAFGGSPPWGPERPVSFSGAIRPGATFEYPIGAGLAVKLVPVGDAWEIDVGRPGNNEDYASCANPPFHGPSPKEITALHFTGDQGPQHWGVGQKRWIDFVLTPADLKLECLSLELALKGDDSDWRSRVTGRCWLRPLSVKLVDGVSNTKSIDTLKFDGECALHGAWELWRLPTTYVIADGFKGWVTVYYRNKGKPELLHDDNQYILHVTEPAMIYTSSDLRQDRRGSRFVWSDARTIPTEGRTRMIWDWQAGDADACAPFQSFFVGTADQHRSAGQNPALKNPAWDCSKVLRIERQ
jgi:hypothetical protein